MRVANSYNESLFTTVRLENFVSASHPLRTIRAWVNEALAKMDECFSATKPKPGTKASGARTAAMTTGRPRTGMAKTAATTRTNRRGPRLAHVPHEQRSACAAELSGPHPDRHPARPDGHNAHTTQADGKAEPTASAVMLGDTQRITVGADKAYDTRGFIKECRTLNVPPHVAQNLKRSGGSAIDARTTRHAGYEISQLKRKCIEQCFGWGKSIGPIRQLMVRGLAKADQVFTLTRDAYNLTRLRSLAGVRP